MKKCYGCLLVASLFMFLMVFRFVDLKSPIENTYFTGSRTYNFTPITPNTTLPLEWLQITVPDFVKGEKKTSEVIVSGDAVVLGLFSERNVSDGERQSLRTWNRLNKLIDHAQSLANGPDAIKEAGFAWERLMASVEAEKLGHTNENRTVKGNERHCPQFLSKMNATEVDGSSLKLKIPCGLTQGSSITVIGIPNGLTGSFRIDLTGEPLPGEPDPPVVLHYNVRLLGDKLTEDPVIVQNSWTTSHGWGEEERCPKPDPEGLKKVDDLDQCNKMVGREVNRTSATIFHFNATKGLPGSGEGSRRGQYFPFKQGFLSVATLRVGTDGIQMTVDGKHITSFAFRETLEPWLVSEVRITGDLELISILASGLPSSEESEHIVDLEELKAPSLSPSRSPDLVIGVFSTANNFKRRMAVRRTWMQYDAVRSGTVAVRFFVGLHKNHIVNQELWNEARTYSDIQLMPFVDYYSLISWKTLAICIYGTEVVSAKFIMKTDDDAFVRVDELIYSLSMVNSTHGLLYGLINSDSQPIRNPDNKWYISYEEWPEEKYPPWAHGPGYIVSWDIAESVDNRFKEGRLKMFKLEDVAMGIWIADMKNQGVEIHYENDGRIINDGCKDGFVVAHYQGPAELICLWRKILETKRSHCCGD
ncbi:PREDICTED: beta-1,3-galactosyltransferase GALT1 isoform X2 [Tarenaya hassleriana]|nr:PREDICTED: beta-1,3-galactosyltransferase GALT1 isoform X2 [Tarenaya hassleriana]